MIARKPRDRARKFTLARCHFLVRWTKITACPTVYFCKLIAGEIPTKKALRRRQTFAFHDINPQAPTHVLIVTKKHIVGLKEASQEDAEIMDMPAGLSQDSTRAKYRKKRLPAPSNNRGTRTRGSQLPSASSYDRRTQTFLDSRIGKEPLMQHGFRETYLWVLPKCRNQQQA